MKRIFGLAQKAKWTVRHWKLEWNFRSRKKVTAKFIG